MAKNTSAPASKPKQAPQPIDYNQFVTIWQSANSSREVAQKTGRDLDNVQQTAYNLRRKGVPLKRFANARQRIDYAGLQALAASLKPIE